MSGARRFNPWVWLPVGVILITAIPNIILVVVAKRAHITKVEEQPWLAAGRLDEQARAQRLFAAQADFMVSGDGHRVTARITGEPPADLLPLRILCYRPSDAQQDRRLAWDDPRTPLAWDAPLPGRWVLALESSGLTLANRAVDIQP